MTHTDSETIIALNDRVLERYVRAGGDAAESEIGRLVLDVAQPVVEQILARYVRGGAIPSEDAGDIAGAINLRLVQKLRRLRLDPGESIQDFTRYVAALTYNGVNDQLRRRFPERARHKNRLRYTLAQDPRLALWDTTSRQACGLAEWLGSPVVLQEMPIDVHAATPPMRRAEEPGDALAAIFTAAGRPVVFEALVGFTAVLWHVAELRPVDVSAAASAESVYADRLESRQILQALWEEIRQLRPLQRKALLLNLRDPDTRNVVSHIVLTGVATFDDLAAALELTGEELAALWSELPLDDNRIAELLQASRQQVINLRKSARERLRRRLKR